jgi:hypothetical protein
MAANEIAVIGGIDTHTDTHQAAIIDTIGRHLTTEPFPTSPAGYQQLLDLTDPVRAAPSVPPQARTGPAGNTPTGCSPPSTAPRECAAFTAATRSATTAWGPTTKAGGRTGNRRGSRTGGLRHRDLPQRRGSLVRRGRRCRHPLSGHDGRTHWLPALPVHPSRQGLSGAESLQSLGSLSRCTC